MPEEIKKVSPLHQLIFEHDKESISDVLCFEFEAVGDDINVEVLHKVQAPAFTIEAMSVESNGKFQKFFRNRVLTITDGKLDELDKKEIDELFKL